MDDARGWRVLSVLVENRLFADISASETDKDAHCTISQRGPSFHPSRNSEPFVIT